MFPLLFAYCAVFVSLREIDHKLSSFCSSVINAKSLEYLPELLIFYIPRQLRSTSNIRLYGIPSFKLKRYEQRSFSCQIATVLDKFSRTVRHSASIKSSLKTHLSYKQPGMSDVSPLSGISGLSFDSTLLSPLLFFCLVLLPFLSYCFLPAGPFF